MGIFHFLNVKQGDCSIIQHPSGHTTVIDVCNARLHEPTFESALAKIMKAAADSSSTPSGNFGQKEYPVNPIEYMRGHGIASIFRYVQTHPDMDHMDGIKDLFGAFAVTNFWDTDHNRENEDFGNNSPYREEDWTFYQSIVDGTATSAPNRLVLHAGARGKYWNQSDEGNGGDGLYILAPTKELITSANQSGDHNDSSYVILYRSNAGRILVMGDCHDDTMDHIVANHRADVADIDVLVAPHHGRHSERCFKFLDVMRPKMTLFGNAPSEHLAYGPWNSRNLLVITNNQADCVVVDTNGSEMQVYVTNEKFARAMNTNTTYSDAHRGWWIGYLPKAVSQAAE